MNSDLFESCGRFWVFQICWPTECSTFTESPFRIWNSSTGIPSPPLALFVEMFPKAYLTSHSMISGSRWVITPLWSSGLWRSFLYSSSVYSCHNIYVLIYTHKWLPRWLSDKESTCQCKRHRRRGFNSWVIKIPWRRKWQATPIFLPRKFHGQRMLAACSPWVHEE